MLCCKESVAIKICRWGGDGTGVGTLPDGKTVFVEHGIPGEQVTARIVREKKNCAWARLEQVIEPAPCRVRPLCPVYEECGGCTLQHMEYMAQLTYKQEQVSQALHRIGKLSVNALPVVAAEDPWGYRNRAVFHVQQQPDFSLGFYQAKSRKLVKADCLLLQQPLRELVFVLRQVLPKYAVRLAGLRELAIRCSADERRLLLIFVTDQPLSIPKSLLKELQSQEPRLLTVWENTGPPVYGVYGTGWCRLSGEEPFLDRLAGVELELTPAAFLQVNHSQAEKLYALIRKGLEPLTGHTVLDVYSGVGSIGLSLANSASRVIGVESYGPSVEVAFRNAVRNRVNSCDFLLGAAEDRLPALAKQGIVADRVVLDPPRSGCERSALEAIAQLAPERMVYVSCDPATLSRDLAYLVNVGYRIESVQPVDMFPQTSHVETVVLLSKGEIDSKKVRVEFSLEDMDMPCS